MSVVNQSEPSLVDESLAQVFHLHDRGSITFVCECPDLECRRSVVLTAAEYAAARPGLILHPSHRAV